MNHALIVATLLALPVAAMPITARSGTIAVSDANVAASASTCTLAQAIYAANLANNPTNATPPGATTIAPLSLSETTTIGIGTCSGAAPGANTIDLAAIAGDTLSFASDDNYWYGPNALPPIASEIVIEGRGVILEIPAATLRRRFFFIGADAAGTRTPGYNTPGAGNLTLHEIQLRGGRQLGGGSTSTGGGGAGFGGAIYNQGRLQLRQSTLSDNRANGGGIGNGAAVPGGGGVGADAVNVSGTNFVGGGMGGAVPGGTAQSGGAASGNVAGAGGGQASGLGGAGGGPLLGEAQFAGAAGNGGGGGGAGTGLVSNSGGGGGAGFGGGLGGGNADSADSGGDFGQGGRGIAFGGGPNAGAGGGGVGGGGGGTTLASSNPRGGGGGGFGGGGGGGRAGDGGDGGFGGGGGGAGSSTTRGGDAGFAGGRGGDSSAPTGGGGGGGAGMGGAIFNHFGVVALGNATFSGNAASGGAGGDNAEDGRGLGGALFNLNGEVDIDHATFVDNDADAGGALYSIGYNGSLLAGSTSAEVTITRSLFADNGDGGDLGNAVPGLSGGDANLAIEVLTVNDSLVENPSGVLVPIGSSENNVLGVDPQLGPLADNGGLSDTHAPATGSVAIDAIDCAMPDAGVDQRGIARPQGARCDIGAVEVVALPDFVFADGFEP